MAEASGQDAEQLLGVVNDAARTVSARLVTFLTVGVYIAVTIASTTDEMLVRASLVTLPLLNVQIPISGVFGFYMIAPWLILVLHCNLLFQLSELSCKLVRFQEALTDLTPNERDRLRDRMANYHYVQFLNGGPEGRFRGVLPGVVLFGSMIVLPLVLLCWTQLRFLPVRDSQVAWSHRLALIADVAAILIFLWPPIMQRDVRVRSERRAHGRLRRVLSLRTAMVLACASVLVFSAAPGVWYQSNLDLQYKVLTGKDLSPETINALKDGDVQERDQELAKVLQLNVLQGRDLRGANFHSAVLPKVDLRTLKPDKGEISYTRLGGADLTWTQMQEALLNDTDAQAAKLQGAQLQGASMVRVKMQGADLENAQLQQADLSNAQLEQANLTGAYLQGATLENAILVDALLKQANLQGANLRGAQLQRADLSDANLEGADLSDANLEGAILRGAQLQGGILCGTAMDAAVFDGANLDLVDICIDHPLDGDVDLAPPICFRQSAGQAECSPLRTPCEDEMYRTSLNGHLKKLACSDAYTARALSARALRVADPERGSLAQVLLDGALEKDCPGAQLLPVNTLESLRAHAPAVRTIAP